MNEELQHSQVIGHLPPKTESFVLEKIEVMTLDADMPGFFTGRGLQIEFEAASLMDGAFSLWLTLADATALHAQIEEKLRTVEGWPFPE